MQLFFGFDDFLNELDYIEDVADDLLESSSAPSVLARAKRDLESIRGLYASAEKQPWEIRESWPLYTAVSKGQYEPGKREHCLDVQAAISFKWMIKPMPPEKPKKTNPAEYFSLAGLASVKVRFFEYDTESHARDDKPFAVYCHEVGMPNQPDGPYKQESAVTKFPGCFFHGSVPFSSDFSVPRLPSYLFTPVSVIEYVLGELFQSEWEDHKRHTKHKGIELAKIHRLRMQATMSWFQDVLKRNQYNSPWLEMKKACPPAAQYFKPPKAK